MSFAVGCHVSLALNRGLTSCRIVIGPLGSVSSWKRCALRKKNSLSFMIGPPICVVKSTYFFVNAAFFSAGFFATMSEVMLLVDRLLLVPMMSNKPE